MKICFFGGSFNPIHKGHIHFINIVKKKILIDKFIIIPANISPLKKDIKSESNAHRLNMLKLGLQKYPDCIIDEYEIEKGGVSYSIDTVEKLKLKYGIKNKYYLLIGSDNLEVIEKWKDYKKLLKMVQFLVVPRNNFDTNEIPNDILNQVRFISSDEYDISSTQVRELIKNKKNISELISKDVEEYIKKNNLYTNH